MNAPAATGPKFPILSQVDDELVRKHIEGSSFAQYVLWIYRKRAASGGADMMTKTWFVEPQELLDGRFEGRVTQEWGGGEYTVEVREPGTTTPLFKYRLTIPGMPKMPNTAAPQNYGYGQTQSFGFSGAIPSGGGMIPGLNIPQAAYSIPGMVPQVLSNGSLTPPPADLVPAFARQLPLAEQWNAVYAEATRSGRLPAGASMHSDAIANQYAHDWQVRESRATAENKELRDRLEKMERERAEEAKRADRERATDRERAAEERHRAEMKLLEQKIDAMNVAPKGPSTAEMFTGLATVLAPIAVAWVQSSAKRDSDMALAQQAQQIELARMGRESTSLIVSTMANKPQSNGIEDIIKLLVPLIPVFMKWQDADSPSKRAEVLQMMNTNMLMNLKMVSDMINSQAEMLPETPSWLPAAQGIIGALLEGLKGMGGFGGMTKALTPAPRGLSSGEGSNGHAPVASDDDGVWRHLESQDPEAAAKTRQAWALMPADAGFHTPEWRVLIFNFYARLVPKELAPLLVDYVEHLFKFGMLPPAFVGPDRSKPPLILSHPRETLTQILGGLQNDPAYTKQIVEACVAEMEERMEPDDEDEDEDEDEKKSTVTPAPDEIAELVGGATVEIES